MNVISRDWRPALVLLLINSAALGCAFFAISEMWFADNGRAAAFPALVALCLLCWQPWLVLLCTVPYGVYAAPFIAVPITLGVYRMDRVRLFLDRPRRALAALGTRTVVSAIAGFLLLGALVTLSGYKDFPVQHRGLPKVNGVWGATEKSIVSNYGVTNSRYYFLSHFLNTSFLWRAQVPRAKVSGLLTQLQLKRVPTGTLPGEFWKEPPYWWRRPSGAAVEEYQTVGFSPENEGEDGWHAGAVYDPQTQTLFLLGQDNF